MKHEWIKKEKEVYLPKNRPEIVEIPAYKFFTIAGEGNPNDEIFPEYIGVLYSLSYGVKMSVKKVIEPKGFFDYTVYPLEGIWDINAQAEKNFTGTINKDDLVFNLMIRQPNFVDEVFAQRILEITKDKKPHALLGDVKFEEICDGKCIQMMHIGPFDSEPESFSVMEDFAIKNNLQRVSKTHREIYLSDVRKVAPEKLKTVLRFQVVDRAG
jgi:hypothetical protein